MVTQEHSEESRIMNEVLTQENLLAPAFDSVRDTSEKNESAASPKVKNSEKAENTALMEETQGKLDSSPLLPTEMLVALADGRLKPKRAVALRAAAEAEPLDEDHIAEHRRRGTLVGGLVAFKRADGQLMYSI